MAKQIINIGSVPGDDTGDTHRDSFDKTNQNFTELYDLLAHIRFHNSNIADDATYIVPDYVKVNNANRALIFIVSNTILPNPCAIFEISGGTMYTVYGPSGSWINGGTTEPNTDARANVWLDTVPNPPQLKIKNRSGSTRNFSIFIFTHNGVAPL